MLRASAQRTLVCINFTVLFCRIPDAAASCPVADERISGYTPIIYARTAGQGE